MRKYPKFIEDMPGFKYTKLRWFALCIHKEFFDIGYGTLSPVKNLIVLGGAGSIISSGGNPLPALLAFTAFAIFAYIFGWFFVKWKINIAEKEVSNVFNPFIGEVRNSKLFKEKAPKKN